MKTLLNLCEIFNIKVSTTASYSPLSNGTYDRHNQFITNMLHKIRDDTKCSYETGLAWAINSRFSSAQLVFGCNCNLPNTLVNHFPALDKTVYSSDLASHIYALHSVRKAFVALESSNKMKLSIKKNICNYQQFYNIGDMVYYKRDSSHEWKGPAKVLEQDRAILFLRHGAKYIKAHICRVQLTDTNPKSHLKNNNIESQQANSATPLSSVHDKPFENAVESSEDEIEYESSSNANNEHETNKNNLKTTKNISLKPNQLIKFTDDENVEYEQLLMEPGKHQENMTHAITSNTTILLNLPEKYGSTCIT